MYKRKPKIKNCEQCNEEILATNKQRFCKFCALKRARLQQKIWTVYNRDFTKKYQRQRERYYEKKRENQSSDTLQQTS